MKRNKFKIIGLHLVGPVSRSMAIVFKFKTFTFLLRLIPSKIQKQFIFESNYNAQHVVTAGKIKYLFETNSKDEYFFEFVNGTFENWEKSSQRWWIDKLEQISEGEIVLDIGAYSGVYSLLAASYGHQVISFEPNNQTLRLLKRNVKINKFEKLVQVQNIGIGNENSTKRLLTEKFRNFSSGASIIDFDTNYDTSTWRVLQNVEIRKLDDLEEIKYARKISLVKIDVEGAELDAIKGSLSMLKKHKPSILVEILDNNDFRKVEEILNPLGYSVDRGFRDSHGGRNFVFQ